MTFDGIDFPRPGALPYLTVSEARTAIDWYTKVFDAQLAGDPVVMDDGRIGHAELIFPTGMVYVAEEFPELCETEREAFAEILGTHVQRLATIVNGDCACTTHVPVQVPLTATRKADSSKATAQTLRRTARTEVTTSKQGAST